MTEQHQSGNYVDRGLTITRLDRVATRSQYTEMEALSSDEPWLSWQPENYAADLPGKWDLSLETRINGELAGYAICSHRGRFIWVHRLVTGRVHRGKGIGSAVIEELMGLALRLEKKGLVLKTPASNGKALNFYLANQFEALPVSGSSAILRRMQPRQTYSVGVHQPNYIPWLGYFYKIHVSDAFVFLDDVSFPTRSFVNRNRVCINGDARWLTVPLKREFDTLIKDALPAEPGWHKKHLRSIELSYKKAPYFSDCFPAIAETIERHSKSSIADMNVALVEAIARMIGVGCLFYRSSSLAAEGAGEERIINLVKLAKGHNYVSGSGGANYQSQKHFQDAGLKLEYSNFSPQPYSQPVPQFLAGLSTIDALFNIGAGEIRRSFDRLYLQMNESQTAASHSVDYSEFE